MHVRLATPDDADAIARVRVATWRAAYDGLIPDAVLDGLDAEGEALSHRARLQLADAEHGRDLVADADGAVVGWAAFGPSTDDPEVGELYAIYVLPDRWSSGVGHLLIEAVETRLHAAGFDRAVLWVLATNERAARFYSAHGWQLDGAQKSDESLGGGTGWVAEEARRTRSLVDR